MFELLDRVRRHASIATGNFERLFAGVEIPPLPTAIARLVAEVNRDEPDQTRLAKMVGAMPEIGGKVLSTVNSAYFALPNQVSSISHGLNLLGMKRIRSLVLSFAMRSALPAPPGSLFDATRFWSDSLLKALLARALADHCCPAEREEAFTAMLLSDIALPVLLGSWGEYYRPLIEQWRDAPERLSLAERASFQWDHAQAGAWILQNWEFPAELVCFVGLHTSDLGQLRELELEQTVALAVIHAARLPSCQKADARRATQMIEAINQGLGLEAEAQGALMERVGNEYRELCHLFALAPGDGERVLALVAEQLPPPAEEG